MLRTSIESDVGEPLLSLGAPVDPGKATRMLRILTAAALAHVVLLGLVVWSEQAGREAGATAAVEIPVEMASAAEAEGRPETQQASPPAAIEPRDDARAADDPKRERPAERPGETPRGQVTERPRETDRPQAARTRGAEPRPEEPQEDHANPFGGLVAVEKPAPVAPTPTFLSPQTIMSAARPRPPQDPTNDNYRAKVLGTVAANMIDPERPRPKALAIVGFRIDAQGGLESAWLARPSGSAELDAEAMDMVRRSAPFPAPPAGAERNFAAAIAFGGD
jgi:TonB family protein